ncbi:MAG: transporter substrate-binding domain-containing protein [Kordiimonadaceae bacterium]|nr:transporter substrate-binding domain-containing protein [Kordiimonadaceae bacterium]
MAFSTKHFAGITKYSDLADYRVATVIGRKSVEKNLALVMDNAIRVENETLAFHMLKVARVDFIVLDEFSGIHYANRAGIQDLHIAELEKHAFHLFVHVSNRETLATLSKALTEMHADGTVQNIIKDVLQRDGAHKKPY